MEESVAATLASGEGDMDYWEAVLKRLKIQKVGGSASILCFYQSNGTAMVDRR